MHVIGIPRDSKKIQKGNDRVPKDAQEIQTGNDRPYGFQRENARDSVDSYSRASILSVWNPFGFLQ